MSSPEIRRRLAIADAVKPDELHSFRELVGDDFVYPDHWRHEAFEELDAQGHLHTSSRLVFGDAAARLSADGRLYLDSLDGDGDAA
jgi:hypothetical protein